ncbi:uncharacterized protein LOC110179668 [Drosophila serrata]|uniref:uncharacterized protein LOC110179668 n=1 Tax=Drosophila serrata TaxID=7274 RepID=UPI000A1D05E5|nr:uncharacterized protein LOC110179668 [Drosophila serrata]
MKCLLIVFAWLSSLFFSSALVHFKTMEKGSNGCKINGKEVAVGEYLQDANTCGAYTCQNKDGDTFIHYCQIPATFAECPETAVVTTIDFPQCCWTCASWGKCGGGSSAGGGGSLQQVVPSSRWWCTSSRRWCSSSRRWCTSCRWCCSSSRWWCSSSRWWCTSSRR